MAHPEQLNLSELRIRARRHLNVPDTATGQWSDARCDEEANTAQFWLGQKLLSFHRYWDPSRSPDLTPSASKRLDVPPDFFWEKRLLKKISGNKTERCRVVRSEEEEGYRNDDDLERETWFFVSGGFEFRGPSSVTGNTYILEYYPRVKKLVEPEDVSVLPSQYHFVIALKMASTMARDTGEVERHTALMAEMSDWLTIISSEAEHLHSLRIEDTQTKDLGIGTLGWLRGEVRRGLSGTSKSPDYWTDARIDPDINKAVMWIHSRLMSFDEGFFLVTSPQHVLKGNTIPLPKDCMRLRALRRLIGTTGAGVDVEVVNLKESNRHTISLTHRYPSSNAYSVSQEKWSVEEDHLISNLGSSAEGTYVMKYNRQASRLIHAQDACRIQAEYMEPLVDRAIHNCAKSAGESSKAEYHLLAAERYMVDVGDDIASIRVMNKVRQVGDDCGFDDESFGGWESGYI